MHKIVHMNQPLLKNNRSVVAALIRLTLLESWRGRSGRFLWMALIAIQLIASFAVQMAVTESLELRLTTAAFLYRLCLIFALGVAMIASVVREHESGFVYVLLAHPISRMHYVLGRILGYSLVAFVAAFSVMCVMAIWVPTENWGALALWSLSLWLELIVTGAVALFFALGLRNMVGAMVMWLAFYVLARVLDVARTMAASPIGQNPDGLQVMLGQWTFNALGWVIPPLGSFTRSEWLLGGTMPGLQAAWILGLWAIVYGAICVVAAAIDFYRHEI
jgi:ABC-type transport system involved in multi-copper enzyme maturation permease subunit